MKKYFSQIFVAAFVFAAVFTSCNDKDEPKSPYELQKEAVIAALDKYSELSEFVAALQKIDFAEIQSDELTVFAVKNSGMSKSLTKATDDESVNIRRQIVKGKYAKSSLKDSLYLTALDGSTLLVRNTSGKISINGVELGEEISIGTSVAFVVEKAIPATAPPVNIPVSGVFLNDSVASLITGGQLTLTASIYPNNATNTNVSWSSSNTQVASVNNGIVTAVNPGMAWITVTTQDGNYTDRCRVVVEAPIDVNALIAQLQSAFKDFVGQTYLVDAYIAQEVKWDSLSYKSLWQFTFNASNSEITAMWNDGYSVIDVANKLAESNANAEVKIDAALKRVYALSALYSYFGGLPLNTNTSRMSSQETADYIHALTDELIAVSPQSQKAKALTLKARILMNQPQKNLQGAFEAMQNILNMGIYQLPEGGSFLPWGHGWTTSSTCESIWEGISAGSIKKNSEQTYYYPMRLTETYLMLFECVIGLQQMNQAIQYNNILRNLWGWDPLEVYEWNVIRSECEYFWEGFMCLEGLRFAYLKRNGLLNAKLDNNPKELLPIPLSALNNNPNLTQNPGW